MEVKGDDDDEVGNWSAGLEFGVWLFLLLGLFFVGCYFVIKVGRGMVV